MKNSRIAIGGRIEISPEFVILLEAESNYTRLYLKDGQQIFVATTLKELEKRFKSVHNFYRTHKSHIVNLKFLSEYRQDSKEIVLQNKMVVMLSRRRTEKFHSVIEAH